MFDVPNTVANAATIAAVNARLAADARLNRAKARLWSLIVVGGLQALVGIGLGPTIAGAQSHVKLVTGKVRLEDAVLRLDNAAVKLDTPGATVRLDTGGVALPHVSETRPQSGAKVVVDYVVFHEVEFDGGVIETAWHFHSSQDATPSLQYCRFETNASTGDFHVWEIAKDGKPITLFTQPPGLDVAGALKNRVWFL